MKLHEEQYIFAPTPYSRDGRQFPNFRGDAPDRCLHCPTRECDSLATPQTGVCRYGFNYRRVDDATVLNGFVKVGWEPATTAWKKNNRRLKQFVISSRDLDAASDAVNRAAVLADASIKISRQAELAEYRESEEFRKDTIALLGPEMERSLGQVHDYRTLVGQIVQNVNVFLDAREKSEFDHKLRESPREIQAIYWAARLMETKLNAALYIQYPERIRDRAAFSTFRFHGLVTKYEKIYEGACEAKGLQITWSGESYGNIRSNSDALGVIPHAFIDNALKYSPAQTEINLDFSEGAHDITLRVSSWGPRIHKDEHESIFDLYTRGREAAKIETEGTGFGLALAKKVADELGLTLSVRQDLRSGESGLYWTSFSLTVPKS